MDLPNTFPKSLPLLEARVRKHQRFNNPVQPTLTLDDVVHTIITDCVDNEKQIEQLKDFVSGEFARSEYRAGERHNEIRRQLSQLQKQLKADMLNFQREADTRADEFMDKVNATLRQNERNARHRNDEIKARALNSRAYRAHHRIESLPVIDLNGHVQEPNKYFPRTVKGFWNLKENKNGLARFSLLQYFSLETQLWEDDDGIQVLDLEIAARHHPMKCLEVLARHLDLDMERIENNMRQLERVPNIQASKRYREAEATTEESDNTESSNLSRREKQVYHEVSRSSTDVISESIPDSTSPVVGATPGTELHGRAGPSASVDSSANSTESIASSEVLKALHRQKVRGKRQ